MALVHHKTFDRNEDFKTLNHTPTNRDTFDLQDQEKNTVYDRIPRSPDGLQNISSQVARTNDTTVGVAQIATIDITAITNGDDFDVAGAVYIELYAHQAGFYVWFNPTTGASETQVDPAPAGLTEIEVTGFGVTDNATTIGAALASAIAGESAFGATNDAGVVTVTNAAVGECQPPRIGENTTSDPGIVYAVTTRGRNVRSDDFS